MWTPNKKQEEVLKYDFNKENKNLLVSAAAGSGKTRVLTEKIINMILDENISLRDILVMTFTVKATQEMKSRIKAGIDERLKNDKNNEHLIRESALIQNANITTIDSFCKSIVEKYYSILNDSNGPYTNFDPSYRIADEKELSILYDDVLNNLLEETIYSNEKEYGNFVNCYFKKDGDINIKENMFLKGYYFLTSIPSPLKKLDFWINNFDAEKSEYIKVINKKTIESVKLRLEDNADDLDTYVNDFDEIISVYKENLCKYTDDYLEKHNNPKYVALKNNLESLISTLTIIKKLIVELSKVENDDSYTKIFENKEYTNIKKVALIAKTNIKTDKIYDDIKSKIEKELEIVNPFIDRASEISELKFYNSDNELKFIKLLKIFYEKVIEEKVKRNIYSIGDYAVLAHEILYAENNKALNDIRENYKYILIDEYQDTSYIQEEIILKISKNNNLMMVGDVKQSIYGFRNAEPEIFLKKINEAREKGTDNHLINMNTNYRSSYEIIGFVNEIFNIAMKNDTTGIDYKIEGAMEADRDANEKADTQDKREDKNFDKKVEVHFVCSENLREYNETNKKLRDEKNKLKEELKKLKKDENNVLIEAKEAEIEQKDNEIKELRDRYEGVDDNSTSDDYLVKTTSNATEAEFIARKIEDLVQNHGFEYKDIVILFRSFYSKADTYIEALARHNIPVFSEMKKGFFNRLEIKLMQDIFSVIDNEQQDIPVADVLCSNIFGLTNNELAFVKLAGLTLGKGNKFINSVKLSKRCLPYIKEESFKDILKEEFRLDKINKEIYFKNKIEQLKDDKKLTDKIEKDMNAEIERQLKVLKEQNDNLISDIEKYREFAKKYNNIDFDLLSKKLSSFIEKFEDLRLSARYYSISELIEEIYHVLDLKNIMLSMDDGVMRIANLDMLYDLAKGYENASFVGLFNFLRYIEKIKELRDDQGLAKVIDENDNVVRIMTIHSSKGLEFKCVFVAGCASTYDIRDTHDSLKIQTSIERGIALDYYDLEKNYYLVSPKKKLISKAKKDNIYKEEMRMLYVALTRAKRKLIVTAAVNGKADSYNKAFEIYKDVYDYLAEDFKAPVKNPDKNDNREPNFNMDSCNSYIDLILSSINGSSKNCVIYRDIIRINKSDIKNTTKLKIDNIIRENIDESLVDNKINELKANSVGKNIENAVYVKEMLSKLDSSVLDKNINTIYSYRDLHKIVKIKYSVSEIKKEHYDKKLIEKIKSNNRTLDVRNYDDKGIPEDKEADNERKDSTEVGNAYHRFMQFYKFVNPNENIIESTTLKNNDNNINQLKLVDIERISSLLNTELGFRMKRAYDKNVLHREHKFMKLFSQNEVSDYLRSFAVSDLPDSKIDIFDEKNIIIQGIIDAFFIENGKIIVLDYKTDGLSGYKVSENALKDNYEVQLNIYAKVLSELTGMEVSEKYIYSFALNKAILID